MEDQAVGASLSARESQEILESVHLPALTRSAVPCFRTAR